MNRQFKYFILIGLISTSGFAVDLSGKSSYWQCITHDNSNKEWIARSDYQKVALNIAFESCKKESSTPETCRASDDNCEGFYQGMSTRPMWKCKALDQLALSWESNFYAQRDDAALGAKAYCKQKSEVPDTCYINMLSCIIYNHGVRM